MLIEISGPLVIKEIETFLSSFQLSGLEQTSVTHTTSLLLSLGSLQPNTLGSFS